MKPDEYELISSFYEGCSTFPSWMEFIVRLRATTRANQSAIFISSISDNSYFHQSSPEISSEDISSRYSVYHDRVDKPVSQISYDMISRTIFATSSIEANCQLSIILEFSPNDSTCFEKAVEIVETLHPHFNPALRIFCRHAHAVRTYKSMEIAISTSRIGLALVTKNGELMISNPVANDIFNRADGLLISNKVVRAARSDDSQMLIDEIARVASLQTPDHDSHIYTPLALRREASTIPLTVIIRPGPAFAPIAQPMRRSALLVMRDPDDVATNITHALRELFGLTNAEANLAAELAKGVSLDDISTLFQVSRNTVKSQLKSIFQKLGVSRQADLVRIVLNSGAAST